MKIIYNNVDIASSVNVKHCNIVEVSEGVDYSDIYFNNLPETWDNWNPSIGDTVNIEKDGLKSGTNYISNIMPSKTLIEIISSAKKSPPKVKYFAWENVYFDTIVDDIAEYNGYGVRKIDTVNYFYKRYDGYGTGLELLSELCMLEGYGFKICNGEIIIYDLIKRYASPTAATFTEDSITEPCFKRNKAYTSCTLVSRDISVTVGKGDNFTIERFVFDDVQGKRWARGYLINELKKADTGRFFSELDTGITAGNTIQIEYGLNSGKWFIYKAIHRLADNQAIYYVRRCFDV